MNALSVGLSMTPDSSPAVKAPSLRSGIAVSLITVLLGLLILEGVARWVFRTPYQWERRLMFFSEGRNLRNTEWGGFVYQPHALIRTRTYYITKLDPPEIQLEYEYAFRTNAQGLVQIQDLSSSKPTILLLGDSFTEGQGAPPWFYRLEKTWPDDALHQVANGGLVGTGVEAWGRLYRALSTDLEIDKVAIIYISDDWTRPVWQFPDQKMACLQAAESCRGSEEFYGLPTNAAAADETVARLAKYRTDFLAKRHSGLNLFANSALNRQLIEPSARRLRAYGSTGSLRGQRARQFEVSKSVVANLVSELGSDNVVFIYLPQKTELASGPRSYGKLANDFILEKGFNFVDGRTECGLTLDDYHRRDGHPNAKGNEKIGACVGRALHNAFKPL